MNARGWLPWVNLQKRGGARLPWYPVEIGSYAALFRSTDFVANRTESGEKEFLDSWIKDRKQEYFNI